MNELDDMFPGMPEPRVQVHPLPCIFNFVGAVRVQTMGVTGA
jgi:hypothetical protein